jgi:hypothetical protein
MGIMEYLLDSIGVRDLRENYVLEDLIELANSISPGRVKNVESKIPNFRFWPGSKLAIRSIFGIDYIGKIEGSDLTIGFDFTTDKTQIQSKLEKAESLKSLWKALGVDIVIILLEEYPPKKDIGHSFVDKNKAEWALIDLVHGAIKSGEEISSATIMLD